MNRPKIYSKHFLTFIRISGIIAIFLICISLIYRIKDYSEILEMIGTFEANFIIAQNIILTIPCILIIFFPEHLEIISILSFLFAMSCSFDYCNPMSPMMLLLSIASLFYRGLYRKHKKLKIVMTIIVCLFFFLFDFRFGSNKGIASFITKVAYSFVVFLIAFFLTEFFSLSGTSENKILIISEYENLTQRDADWLIKVKNGIKYDAIAIEDCLALSTVKNRLREIYRILQVGDKQGFMSIYGDWTIVFENPTKLTPGSD